MDHKEIAAELEHLRRQRKTFENRYEHFLSLICEQIRNGSLQPGDPIGTETDLCHKYRLSRGSVRKGLAVLVERGLLTKLEHKGHFVCRANQADSAHRLTVGLFMPNLYLTQIRSIIEEYERCVPDTQVQLMPLQSGGYIDILQKMAMTSNLPDVIMLPDRQFRQLGIKDHLFDMSSLGAERTEAFYSHVTQAFTIDQRLYALPFVFSPVVLCYNRALFDEAGLPYPDGRWSWADILAAAQRLTHIPAVGNIVKQYGLQISPYPNRLGVYLLQNEASLTDADGKPTLDSERVIEAVEFCVNCMYRHHVSPILTGSYDADLLTLFAAGRIGMTLASYLEMNGYTNLPFPWAIAPPMRGRNTGTVLISIGLAVSRNSANLDAALQLVKFMTDRHAQTILKASGTSLPALRSVAADRDLAPRKDGPEGYYLFEEVLPYSKNLSMLGDTWLEILCRELELTWHNMESPADGCARAQRRAEEKYYAGITPS